MLAWTGRTTGPAGPASVLISVGEGAEPHTPRHAAVQLRRLAGRGGRRGVLRNTGRSVMVGQVPTPFTCMLRSIPSALVSAELALPPGPALGDQGVEAGAGRRRVFSRQGLGGC